MFSLNSGFATNSGFICTFFSQIYLTPGWKLRERKLGTEKSHLLVLEMVCAWMLFVSVHCMYAVRTVVSIVFCSMGAGESQ